MVPGASSHRVRARRGVLRSDAHPHQGVMPVESTAANVSSPSASHDGIMEKTEKREQIAKQFPKIALLRRMEASMGPGPDGPGKPRGGSLHRGRRRPLQWGRGRMAPENHLPLRFSRRGHTWLQWGRGRMAPENRPAEQEPVANGVASMGPGPDGPGKHLRPPEPHSVF